MRGLCWQWTVYGLKDASVTNTDSIKCVINNVIMCYGDGVGVWLLYFTTAHSVMSDLC